MSDNRIKCSFRGTARLGANLLQAVNRGLPLAAACLSLLCVTSALADGPSTAATGINSQAVNNNGYFGTGVGIGQVELARPGLQGFDNNGEWFIDTNGNTVRNAGEPFADFDNDGFYSPGWLNYNASVTPTAVFNINGAALPAPIVTGAFASGPRDPTRHKIGAHAEQVAGVMISTHGTHIGVASGAKLYSSAFVPGDAVLAMQHVAIQNGGDIRAINMSWGQGGGPLDGSSNLTLALDWSARVHDTLYVVSGNENATGQSPGGFARPTDEFNGLTVGYTEVDGTGNFRQVDPDNYFAEDAVGSRRSMDLVAPGTNITMPTINNAHEVASGTSFAAPHVTGTVALLGELADDKIQAGIQAGGDVHWSIGGGNRRHEVFKAVLMNSTDKVQGILGMQHTILNARENFNDFGADGNPNTLDAGEGDGIRQPASEPFIDSNNNAVYDNGGQTWLQGDAASNVSIPLDFQMGTGQLNADRAFTQFEPGEWDSNFLTPASVPLIGWDLGSTSAATNIVKYLLNKTLLKDSYISATLAWDRLVTLNDTNLNNQYDTGETFTNGGLTDLDLYLVPAGGNLGNAVDYSISNTDSVEHLFFQIPDTGMYELWVQQAGFDGPLGFQTYGLAWWAVPEPGTFVLAALGAVALMVSRRRSQKLRPAY